LNGGVQIEQSN